MDQSRTRKDEDLNQPSPPDLGTSSDRAMMTGRGEAEERNQAEEGVGISNRPLDEEQAEQEKLPERGQSREES